jgi:hypothetical protein
MQRVLNPRDMPVLLHRAQLLRLRPRTRGLQFKHIDARFAKQYQHKTYIEPPLPAATYPPPLAQRIRGDFTVAVTFFDDEVTLPKAR